MGKGSRRPRKHGHGPGGGSGRYTPPAGDAKGGGNSDPLRRRSGPRPDEPPRRHWSGGPYDGVTPRPIDLVVAAARATWVEDEEASELLVGLLVGPYARSKVEAVVDGALAEALVEALGMSWARGWQPTDVARLIGRRLSTVQRSMVMAAIAVEFRKYAAALVDPGWSDQVRALADELAGRPEGLPDPTSPSWALRGGGTRRASVEAAVEVLANLASLPEIPRLCPLPGEGSSRNHVSHQVDEGVLRRVRGLLAKAESTTFEAEAQALTAKAQELMSRHAIDRAALSVGAADRDAPVGVRVGVDDPYAQPKAVLLAEVAGANRCQAVWSKQLGFSTVFGFRDDIEGVELLYTSLLVQATVAMTSLGSQRSSDGRSRTRSFRQSFLTAYATRIGQRLRTASLAAEGAAVGEHGTSLLPVLADRRSAVAAEVDAAFPETSHVGGPSSHNAAGWRAGHAAAELAALWGAAEVSDEATA